MGIILGISVWNFNSNYNATIFQFQLHSLIQSFFTVWFDTMDSMTQPERRKLAALALASLLPVNVR